MSYSMSCGLLNASVSVFSLPPSLSHSQGALSLPVMRGRSKSKPSLSLWHTASLLAVYCIHLCTNLLLLPNLTYYSATLSPDLFIDYTIQLFPPLFSFHFSSSVALQYFFFPPSFQSLVTAQSWWWNPFKYDLQCTVKNSLYNTHLWFEKVLQLACGAQIR